MNILDGAWIPGRLNLGAFGEANENVHLNVLGGYVNIVDAWHGSKVNVLEGSIRVANLLGGHANRAGGNVQKRTLFDGSHLNISGGYAEFIETAGLDTGPDPNGSHLLITGGKVATLDATGNVAIEGGVVGDDFIFRGGGHVEIAEGTIGDFFEVGVLSSDGISSGEQGQVTDNLLRLYRRPHDSEGR